MKNILFSIFLFSLLTTLPAVAQETSPQNTAGKSYEKLFNPDFREQKILLIDIDATALAHKKSLAKLYKELAETKKMKSKLSFSACAIVQP